MKTIGRKLALVALSTTALMVVSHSSQAATLTISGGQSLLATPGEFPGYGTAIPQNNVVNNPASKLVDTTGLPGSSWITSSAVSPTILLAPSGSYTIGWTYLGSESNNTIQLITGAFTFAENNANNNCGTCALPLPAPTSPQTGPVALGISAGSTTTVAFSMHDVETGATLANGPGNSPPGSGFAGLIFSYATFDPGTGIYSLTPNATSFAVFGFNDNGGADDNHDDFMGVATLLGGGTQGVVPIPAALPLFGSVLGGGFLFRRLRNRRKVGAPSAA